MSDPTRALAPAPLKAAACIAVLEALVFVVLTVIQVGTFTAERATMGWTTAVFFVLWAALLVGGAVLVLRGESWARSPLVMAQLIHLGVAWSFVQGDPSRGDQVAAWLIAASSVAAIVAFFHPRSIEYLADEDPTTA